MSETPSMVNHKVLMAKSGDISMKFNKGKLTDDTFSIDETEAKKGLDLSTKQKNPGEYSHKRLTNWLIITL